MKAKLELTISFLSSLVNQACGNLESVLAEHLKQVALCANPMVRAERLLDGLRKYASPVAQAPLLNRVAAVEVLKDLLQQVETEPGKELSYEFGVGRQGDDCEEGRDVTVPLDESKITGRTRELLVALRLAEAEIEWPPRQNSFKARFVIKAGASQ
jgi:hypothetical protein